MKIKYKMRHESIKSAKRVLYSVLMGAAILSGCGKNVNYDGAMRKQYEADKQSVMEAKQEFIRITKDDEALKSLEEAFAGIEKLIEKTKEMPVLDIDIQEGKLNVRR